MAESLSTVACFAAVCALSAVVNFVCALVRIPPNTISDGTGVAKFALPVNAVLMFVHCWMICSSDRFLRVQFYFWHRFFWLRQVCRVITRQASAGQVVGSGPTGVLPV